jgi:hypothetical protein
VAGGTSVGQVIADAEGVQLDEMLDSIVPGIPLKRLAKAEETPVMLLKQSLGTKMRFYGVFVPRRHDHH